MNGACRRQWNNAKLKYQREGLQDFYISLEKPLHAHSPYMIRSFAAIHWAIGFEKGRKEYETPRGTL